MFAPDRRFLLAGIVAAGLFPALPGRAQTKALPKTPPGLRLGAAHTFSFDGLKARAKKLAASAYQAQEPPAKAIIQGVDFDKVQKIRFRPEEALWRGVAGTDPIAFFHLNRYSADPVTIFALQTDTNGQTVAREILYRPDYFDYAASGLDPAPLAKLGFAGFRVMESQTSQIDWLAFQGASYFRSSGQDGQYGASARGIAVNTALQTAEEFPRFSQFWLSGNGPVVTIYAILEGPSLTGAYKFDCIKNPPQQSGNVVINVHCDLFFRADISRLGIAPLTSMYWYSENDRPKAADWRPEIHDNDGLAIFNGKGERIWRPLINPPTLQTNSFMDNNPKGFGLMQRDREFEDYQDDGAFYNKRPGIWVEPKGNWGKGSVQLVEIPTDDEIHDNIVVYWRPDAPIKSGDGLSFDYRLYWQDSEPNYPKSIARAVATRIGRGGVPGQTPPPANKRKFAIDWEGGILDQLQQRYDLTPVVNVSNGKAEGAYVIKVVGTNRWRSLFDISIDTKTPIDLRCYLKLGDKTLTETWIYQYFP
ncbi:MAG TPA: glucan biosynthesis protein D [Rhizomicrobium sp.]|nr:glucan biosynthesis protein D [Rhizomicrobium sp.]